MRMLSSQTVSAPSGFATKSQKGSNEPLGNSGNGQRIKGTSLPHRGRLIRRRIWRLRPYRGRYLNVMQRMGKGMLFDKDVRKVCAFCLHATDFTDNMVLCKKCGPVSIDHYCRKFKYDPLRRTPPLPGKIKLPAEDDAFTLE